MENRLKQIAFDGALSLSLAFGQELGLFDALAAAGNEKEPATIKKFAEKAGIEEEFASVWLVGMVTRDIVKCNESDDGFWIAPENLPFLTGEEPAAGLMFSRLLPIYASHYKQAIDMAKGKTTSGDKKADEHQHGHGHHQEQGHQHGHQEPGHQEHGAHGHDHGNGQGHGHDWSKDNAHGDGHHGHGHGDNHAEAFPLMEQMSKAVYKKPLIPQYLPLTGVKEQLEKGGMQVLDVGCGVGFHLCEFARNFPKNNYVGIDISPSIIKRAQKIADESGLTNVKFEVISGEKMPEEWTKKYDWICSFNSIHDHGNPQNAINEISRVLKDDGRYTMLEINKAENPFHLAKQQPLFFNASGLFIVLPVRGKDTHVFKWSNKLAVEMLKNAGFKNVETVETPFYEMNVLFIGTK